MSKSPYLGLHVGNIGSEMLFCHHSICLGWISFKDHLKDCGEEYSFYLVDKFAQINSELHSEWASLMSWPEQSL